MLKGRFSYALIPYITTDGCKMKRMVRDIFYEITSLDDPNMNDNPSSNLITIVKLSCSSNRKLVTTILLNCAGVLMTV